VVVLLLPQVPLPGLMVVAYFLPQGPQVLQQGLMVVLPQDPRQ
jgi:hypothetical protein